MANIDVACPILGCSFSTGVFPETIAVALLNTHAFIHAPGQAGTSTTSAHPAGPKLDRPRVGISMEEWNMFQRRCDVFQT